MTNYSFFIDIDGTLVTSHRPYVSEKMRKVAIAARKEGARFFINTARSHAIVPLTLADPEVFDGVCSGGGTHIELCGKCVYSRYLAPDVLMDIASTYEKLGEKATLILEGADTMLFLGERQPWCDERFIHTSSHELEAISKDVKIQKFSTSGKTRLSDEFIKRMSVRFDIIDHTRYIEGMEYGYDKGGAIKLAERELNIPHETTVAIGDSMNDLPMLKYAEISVAMGNASDEIKKLCTFVTDSADDDGVANAIEKLCFGS